ncbi:DUF2334 domain-containing protein [Natrinema sp. H-ect4]|uniref:DUF2334 domain-containing protein n=1 Tax=Natrinema sp. H-ect4 TaxID=3242699 RepID=UPI0035A988FA
MSKGEGEAPRQTCPRCGSSAVLRLRVMEHKSCGAIKPRADFHTGEDITCPDCGVQCDDDVEYVAGGTLYTCDDCGCNFGEARRGVSTDDDEFHEEAAAVLENVRSRLTTTSSSWHRWGRHVGLVLVLVAFVSAAAIAAVGPSVFQPDQAATEEDPASVGTAPEPESLESINASDLAVPVEMTWSSYRSIVIFRNDDIQPNYRADVMRDVDQVFIDEGVPVTQGVIPARSDGELCQYLQQQQRAHPETFEYALHGYTHERRTEFNGGSEFGGLPPDRQAALIRAGTAAMRDCVDETPMTFVPPFNTYDNATARALADEGYTAVSGGGWFTAEYYNETDPFTANGTVHVPNTNSFVRNWTTNEFYSQSSLEGQFDDAYRNGDLYVQMLHYQAFTSDAELETLRGLIGHMKSRDDVAFMTVGEFAHKQKHGLLERTETGWRVKEQRDENETEPARSSDRNGSRAAVSLAADAR